MGQERGVSLIESLLMVATVGMIVFLIASVPNSMMLIEKSRHLSLAREIAVKQIEDKRAITYSNLTNDTIPVSDSRINLLPQGSGEVTVEDCSSTVCANGEHAKQVTVTVSWVDNSKNQSVSLKTLVGESGINQ